MAEVIINALSIAIIIITVSTVLGAIIYSIKPIKNFFENRAVKKFYDANMKPSNLMKDFDDLSSWQKRVVHRAWMISRW